MSLSDSVTIAAGLLAGGALALACLVGLLVWLGGGSDQP